NATNAAKTTRLIMAGRTERRDPSAGDEREADAPLARYRHRATRRRQRQMLPLRVHRVTTALPVPLGDRRGRVHLLHDVPPADPRIVRAEADLTLLRAVRDDAHLGPPEIVVEEVLEPHPGHEQETPAELRRVALGGADALAARAGLAEELTHE